MGGGGVPTTRGSCTEPLVGSFSVFCVGAGTDVSLIKEVHVAEERKGAWRVEEEFVGAIRGQEKVTLTDFGRGHRYMEFTEAVTRSIQSGAVVKLPLLD